MKLNSLSFMMLIIFIAFGCAQKKTTITAPQVSSEVTSYAQGTGAQDTRSTKILITPSTRPAIETASTHPATSVTLRNNEVITAPQGSAVSIDITESGVKEPDIHRAENRSTASGASIVTNDSAATAGFHASAPTVSTGGKNGGVTLDGGDTTYDSSSIVSVAKKGTTIFYILGALVIVAGGIVAWIRKSFLIAGLAAGLGLLLILCGVLVNNYPWILVLMGLATLAIIGWWIWDNYLHHKKDKALEITTQAIENVPPTASDPVKAQITNLTADEGTWFKNLITKIKDKLSSDK